MKPQSVGAKKRKLEWPERGFESKEECEKEPPYPLQHFMVCNVIREKEYRSEKTHTCIIEPFLKQWLEFAHVFKAQVQGLKARNGGLAEVISVKFSHGKANIPLVHARQQY